MRVDYAKLLGRIRGWAVGSAAFIIITVVGGFILQLCTGASWYEHPWVTVGKMINLVQWLLAVSWFHWVGGLAIGLAIGIWLDDALRRLAARSAPIIVTRKIEKGALDYELDVERTTAEMMRLLDGMRTATHRMMSGLKDMPAKIERLTKQAQTSREKNLQRTLTTVNGMAGIFDAYGRRITELSERFAASAAMLIGAVRWLVKNQPRQWRSKKSLSDLVSLRATCSAGQTTRQKLVEVLGGLRGVSAVLNEQIDRAIEVSSIYEKALGGIVDFCTEVLDAPATTVTPVPLLPPSTEQETQP